MAFGTLAGSSENLMAGNSLMETIPVTATPRSCPIVCGQRVATIRIASPCSAIRSIDPYAERDQSIRRGADSSFGMRA